MRYKKAVFVDKDENGFRGTTLIRHTPSPFQKGLGRRCRAHFALTGEPGWIYFRFKQMFNPSTPERRSALLLNEGSQPVTFNFWQAGCAYSSRSTSSSFNCVHRL